MANRITMSICGEDYTLVADESAAYMEKVGALVDEKMTQLQEGAHVSRSKVFRFVGAQKGRQQRLSQGKCSFPCAAQAANVGAWRFPCAHKLSVERTTPARVYKCALVTKGIIWLSPPRLVFSNTPALLNSLQCDTKSPCLRPPSWFSAPARCFP